MYIPGTHIYINIVHVVGVSVSILMVVLLCHKHLVEDRHLGIVKSCTILLKSRDSIIFTRIISERDSFDYLFRTGLSGHTTVLLLLR